MNSIAWWRFGRMLFITCLGHLQAMGGLSSVTRRGKVRIYPFRHETGVQEGEAGSTSTSIQMTKRVRWEGWSSSELAAIHGGILPIPTT